MGPIVVFVLVFLICAELFARAYLLHQSKKRYHNSDPKPPIATDAVDSEGTISGEISKEKEQFKVLDIQSRTKDPLGSCPEFAGTWLTIDHGKRRTTDTPYGSPSRVLCLGGSTTFCGDVADEHTWPSVLQRYLNRQCSRVVVVENLGRMGATASNRLQYLRKAIVTNDVAAVILLFGVNDAGWVQLRDLQGLSLPIRQLVTSGLGMSRFSYRFLGGPIGRRCGRDASMNTVNEIKHTAYWLSERNIPLIAVLQPYYWSGYPLPKQLTVGNSSPFQIRVDFLHALKSAYETYGSELLRIPNVVFHNFQSVLDTARETAYVDWIHLNTIGCAEIGGRIGQVTEQVLS